ncbi:MAG: GNAT family N-acetyltransferase [bacterium]|nr:GNAT family N-acetyltransferase [bacterium]
MCTLTEKPHTIRQLTADEIPAALSLAWEVFSEYESPVYSEEGTEEFRRCLHDETYLSGITYYGAFDGETLIGEIGIRARKKHICFFFVKGSYHRRGIGTRLFKQLLRDVPSGTITLNSSPYGLPFYRALGFIPTDHEQTVNGIRFTPMEYRINADSENMQ